MSWDYVLRDELRMPPCPYCGSLSGTVRLKGSIYACLDCLPRRAFEAHWMADDLAVPLNPRSAVPQPSERAASGSLPLPGARVLSGLASPPAPASTGAPTPRRRRAS